MPPRQPHRKTAKAAAAAAAVGVAAAPQVDSSPVISREFRYNPHLAPLLSARTMEALRKEFRCDIGIDDNVPGLVTLEGPTITVTACCEKLTELTTTNYTDDAEFFIEELREPVRQLCADLYDEYLVTAKFVEESVMLTGSKAAVEVVKREVQKYVSGDITTAIDFPSAEVKHLIGKDGKNINEIRNRLRISINPDSKYGKVHFNGERWRVLTGITEVNGKYNV